MNKDGKFIRAALIALGYYSENESYGDYIKRISKSTIATYVKYCDLEDNLDIRRLSKISEQDIGRINKYLKWYRFLEKVINDRG